MDLTDVSESMGCETCGATGYKGRTGVYELLFMDDAVRAWAARRGSRTDFENRPNRAGFGSLVHRAAQQAARGVTTPAEVVRVLGPEHTGGLRPE